MAKKLTDSTALVTGGGRGIGRAICNQLSQAGARVAVADIDLAVARETEAELPTSGLAISMDISSKNQVDSAFSRIHDHFGQLDILVNNAGIFTFTTFEDCTEDMWDRILNVNLKGTFLCCQAALPHMKARRKGSIVNMTSLAAKSGGLAAGPPYTASKAGVSALTIGLARAAAPFGIRVNGVAPGVIDTDMTRTPMHDRLTEQIPLKEKGRPEDVAHTVLFLASDDARHITGEIIDVNGGLFMD
ncbi:MAG: SDR family oxidoreductase [Gemmatimonadetes bacterium]|jgi:3-oxoacyl-[acyl-carrier protein] reductase|nr:SDR family oxidoreductase [Gemmatimonadota bacterium]